MSSTVVNKRIDTPGGPADYTGAVNAEGAPHGRGSYVIVTGDYKGSTYNGIMISGQREGVGKYARSNGGVYAGDWKADQLNGFGHGQVCVLLCVS
jgi:hypothetical protein